MLSGGGSRLSTHLRLRDCDLQPQLGFGFGLGSRLRRRSLNLKPRISSFPSIIPSNSFSQGQDQRELPSDVLSSVAGGIVALGKFDALHIGHRELAIQASKVGPPFLLSFVGMAEVLGWEPRAPIVAKCDRKRILSTWAPYCGNMVPEEFEIQFSSVRKLTPREFVEKLLKEFGVCGVVAGENYRFGYKAAGDATELMKLCEEYGMGAYIIKSVMDKNPYSINTNSDSKDRGQVSSTRVRRALAVGDMKYVSKLLGRQHRVILVAKDEEGFRWSRHKLSVPKSCMLNLGPKEGLYGKCYVLIGDEGDLLVPCSVVIDTAYIHIETDEVVGKYDDVVSSEQDMSLIRIEFGDMEC
ncbi:FAD synthetase 2, chloroplastic [Argentina anserina]|uniref:FAD synthetase 2, chloroplastic n=1 Tax=Argentina anserina TaxID=57926 RepID=UPI0021769377|nr:FAD synthetase 2, chloroplastic [Potentilla anserina]